MAEKKAVRINIDPQRKAEWDRIADETNRTLSDTLRKAMSEFIARQDGNSDDGNGIPDSVEEEIYATSDTVDNLHQQINEISNRFDLIESEVRTNRETRTIANEVYEILPNAEEVGNPTTLSDGTDTLVGTTKWIADMLNESEGMAEQAITQLLSENFNVHEIAPETGDGYQRFYKEDR